MKTSTQVVGTSGSQKSSMVCFQGMTSQGTFRLGQLKTFLLSVMTPGFKKKLAPGLKQKEHWKRVKN